MAKVYLGIGSNIQPRHYIRLALVALQAEFGVIELSPIYESEPVGFDGDNFLNLVVCIQDDTTVGKLQAFLKTVENTNDRDRLAPKFSGRTLDIDILLFDDAVGTIDDVVLPRDEVLKNAFVLKPLCDLAPGLLHPVNNKTMEQLWFEYDKSKQKLWPVSLAG